MTTPLLTVKNLRRYFPLQRNFWGKPRWWKKAVDDVSFTVERGKTYALVGESGCGKTTIGRSLLRLIEPTGGEVWHDGVNLLTLSKRQMTARRRRLQMIFQDPYSSLNSRWNAGALVGEGWDIHRLYPPAERDARLAEIFAAVGLLPEHANRYPHEFSGGQRQRLCIARALALSPEFIVCDEAVSALDVSIQAQIINLLMDLQIERGIAYLFISHNLAVVRQIAERVGVMYAGQLVEEAATDELFADPRHPYTQTLLSAIPAIGAAAARQIAKPTARQNLAELALAETSGCPFGERCPQARAVCRRAPAAEHRDGDRRVRCHLFD
ncbi:MAG: ATP-binding cassette domain-containing protein [Planctomycetota bacterium]|jgi:oligopeptide/dipeptide ABC transporter ATP-binding protein|nr:ATP-binding cassette domain-containing protein [Planctomycetota bacterium]